MARIVRRRNKSPSAPRPSSDPHSIAAWSNRYVEWMAVHNYSPKTMRLTRDNLGGFIAWCDTRSINAPMEVSLSILERYQRHVFHVRKSDGKPLSISSQVSRLISVKMFFRWLTRQHVLMFNPASELQLPRREFRLPNVLTPSEAETILSLPDITDLLGLRDRAIMEVLYSTGIRRSELVALLITDVDFERKIVVVRQGKGHKDRVVPIGERALAWVRRYLDDVRSELAVEPDEGVLFLSQLGEAMHHSTLSVAMGKYVQQSKLGKQGSCHLWRHSMATGMLDNGADIRIIQVILGHEVLSSTQIYTHVAIRKVQEVHALTHPAATPKTLESPQKSKPRCKRTPPRRA